MSTLAIILIVVGVLVVLLLVGGLTAARRRARDGAVDYAAHVAAADHALEAARAADRGWDREVMEDVARAALNEHHPGWDYRTLELVLVDDRPGIDQDRAEFEAADGDRRVRVTLARDDTGWSAERVA